MFSIFKAYREYFLSLFLRRFFFREDAISELSPASELVLVSSASEVQSDFEQETLFEGSM